MMNVNTIVVGRKLSSQSGNSHMSIDNNNRSFSQNSSRRGSLMKVSSKIIELSYNHCINDLILISTQIFR